MKRWNVKQSLAAVCATVLLCVCGCGAGSGGNAPSAEAVVTLPPSEPETTPAAETEPEPETAPEPVRRGKLIGDNQDLLTDGQKEAIFNYMDRYYEARSSLEMKDLSDLFAASAAGQKAFHENSWEYMIEMRRMQKSDLRLNEYLYRMWILNVTEQEDGSVDVDMGEQSLLRFALMPEIIAEYPGYWHDFVLVQENGRWVLAGHMQWEGAFWNMLKGHRDEDLEELENADEVFAERKELLLSQVAEDLERREQMHIAAEEGSVNTGAEAGAKAGTGTGGQTGADAAGQIPLHEYDREAAVAYARAHVDERNGDWHDYSGEGGNCQNFVSQCLLAGGIPMDTEGSARWKWYGEALNDDSGETGCTLSWINVDYFYAYARDNRGSGLAARVDADFMSGQVGDLIMMGPPEDWNHMVIISEVVKDENGETIDYLICSNTTDVQDFPASAYPSPRRSLIKILGWN